MITDAAAEHGKENRKDTLFLMQTGATQLQTSQT